MSEPFTGTPDEGLTPSTTLRGAYLAGGLRVIGEVLRARGKEPLENTIERLLGEFREAIHEEPRRPAPDRNSPRRRKGLLAVQGGLARATYQQATGRRKFPATFEEAQEIAALFPGRIIARLDYRKNARRLALLYADGVLILSYPADEPAGEAGDRTEP